MIQSAKWEGIFLGTGSSSSVPRLKCKIKRRPDQKCVCVQEPFNPKNNRLNPSLLLKRTYPGTEDYHILIDMGKTFRESVLNHFEKFKVNGVDSIVITHGHCDAYGGLDDVRDLTDRKPGMVAPPVDLYADSDTIPKIKAGFPYLFPELRASHGPTAIGTLQHKLMDDFEPFQLSDMNVIPIPLHHGHRTRCMGFSFSCSPDSQVVYFSDFRHVASGDSCSTNPNTTLCSQADYDNFTLFLDAEKTLAILKEKSISVLVLDCLRYKISTTVHSVFPETLELIKAFKKIDVCPQKIYFTGMDCSIDYPVMKQELLDLGFHNTEPGYDGLSFTF